MIDFTLTLRGTRPLIVHSARLADPLDPAAKEVKRLTRKRNKTDEDHHLLARTEFFGGIYFDEVEGPYIPGANIFKCLIEGGRKTKQGKQVEQGVLIKDDVIALGYKGPRTVEELYAAKFYYRASVKVGASRVMRVRPWFPEWAIEVNGTLDTALLELVDIERIATTAGLLIGLAERRPLYGRFEVVGVKQS
jgi:hypothetical protein